MSVSVSNLLTHLQASDVNRDGLFSKQEIASAAIGKTNEASPITAGSSEFSVLFSILAGGKDGLGLFPDANTDGQLSASELQGLAGADGQADSFTPNDFSIAFPARAGSQNLGTADAFKKLEQIAGQNLTQEAQAQVNSQFVDLKPQTSSLLQQSGNEVSQLGNIFSSNSAFGQQMTQLMQTFMQMLTLMFQQMLGG